MHNTVLRVDDNGNPRLLRREQAPKGICLRPCGKHRIEFWEFGRNPLSDLSASDFKQDICTPVWSDHRLSLSPILFFGTQYSVPIRTNFILNELLVCLYIFQLIRHKSSKKGAALPRSIHITLSSSLDCGNHNLQWPPKNHNRINKRRRGLSLEFQSRIKMPDKHPQSQLHLQHRQSTITPVNIYGTHGRPRQLRVPVENGNHAALLHVSPASEPLSHLSG